MADQGRIMIMEPSPLYESVFDPDVLDELLTALGDHEAMEQEFGSPPWLADQYDAARNELRDVVFPTISARFVTECASSVWLNDAGPTEAGTISTPSCATSGSAATTTPSTPQVPM